MGGSPNLTPVTGFKFETTMAQKLNTDAEFLSALNESVTTLRKSPYSTTIAFAKFSAGLKSKCKFTKDGDRYSVVVQTDFGPIYASAKTNQPAFIAIVECPQDTTYDFIDPKTEKPVSGTINAGSRKLVFY